MVRGLVLLAQRIRIVEGKSSSRRHRGLDRSGTEVLMFFSLDFASFEGVISAHVRRASVSPCLYSDCHQPFYRQLVCRQPCVVARLLPPLYSSRRSNPAAVRVLLLLYFCRRSSSRCSISARSTSADFRILPPFDCFRRSTPSAVRLLLLFESCRRSTPYPIRH